MFLIPATFCELRLSLITTRVRSTREGNVLTPVCVSVHTFGGGSQVSDFQGVTDFQGGPRSQIFRGGPRSQIFGGVPGLRFSGGVPGLTFLGGYLVSVKGKNFDTRFGLIHVQTGKNFLSRTLPPSKGKKFWHQSWLDTCSDWEKKILSRDPPPQ